MELFRLAALLSQGRFFAPQAPTATLAPTYVGAVQPGFSAGPYAVGTPIVFDLGAALNNPTGYDIVMFRSGTGIAGATASNVTSFSYTPVSADSGQVLSATVVARNSVGPSEIAYISGVLCA